MTEAGCVKVTLKRTVSNTAILIPTIPKNNYTHLFIVCKYNLIIYLLRFEKYILSGFISIIGESVWSRGQAAARTVRSDET